LLAEDGDGGVVLFVVQVGVRADQRAYHRVGDLFLLVGEARIGAGPERLDLRLGEPGVAADRLVRGPLVAAVPGLRHHQDGHLAHPG